MKISLGLFGNRGMYVLPSEHLAVGRDTREGVVVENRGNTRFLQPSQTFLL